MVGNLYENYSYLNEVIFRIDFSSINKLSENNKESANDFHKKISDEFPIIIKRNHKMNINFVDTGEPTKIIPDGSLMWVFYNKNKDKSVELTQTSLILHYKKGAYTNFRFFLDDIILLIDALKQYNPKNLNFLGLRYINQIDGKSISEIKECINPKYFESYIDDFDNDEEFIQVLNRLSIKKGNYLLNFQYGLFNGAYPEPNFDKDFILDFDCITKKVKLINDVVDELKNMNKYIWLKFEDAITDSLRD